VAVLVAILECHVSPGRDDGRARKRTYSSSMN
jgi:hypothetical protein